MGKNLTLEVGNDIAKEAGYESAKALIDDTNAKLKSRNATTYSNAKAAALDFTQKLLRLCLYQEIQSEYNLDKYSWVNKFDDIRIEAGDSKEFIKSLHTGIDTYSADAFVPTNATPPSADATRISLYKTDGSVNDYGFKAIKPLTILETQWFPYFISGKLMEFVSKQIQLMRESMFLYKYKVLTTLIAKIVQPYNASSNTLGINKRITGQATNILTAFTNEIFPEIENMLYLNNQYAHTAAKNSQYPNVSNRNDLLIIMNRNTLNKFRNGVMSNKFNAQLVNFNSVVPLDNIIGTGANIEVGASTDNISVSSTELLSDNQVLVINKNLIKYLWFVDITDSQKFVQNMSIQYVQHMWGVFGVIPWEAGFLYENTNLSVLPISIR